MFKLAAQEIQAQYGVVKRRNGFPRCEGRERERRVLIRTFR